MVVLHDLLPSPDNDGVKYDGAEAETPAHASA